MHRTDYSETDLTTVRMETPTGEDLPGDGAHERGARGGGGGGGAGAPQADLVQVDAATSTGKKS